MASLVVSGSAVSAAAPSGILSVRNAYTSLDRVRDYLALASQHGDTADNNQMKDFIRTASRRIDEFCERSFYPRRQTRNFDLPDKLNLIKFDEEILEVHGLSDVNGASEVDSSVYWLRRGANWNESPYDRIELDRSSGSLFNFSGTDQRAIAVDATWGYHEDYDDAWVDIGASLIGNLPAAQTLASISGSTGADAFGLAPRIREDSLLKIDDEFIHVVTGETVSNIRVLRGQNGTTAASHGSATTLYRWEPENAIEYSARELAAFQYLQSTAPLTGQTVTFMGAGFSIERSESWPPATRSRLKRFKKRRVYSIKFNGDRQI